MVFRWAPPLSVYTSVCLSVHPQTNPSSKCILNVSCKIQIIKFISNAPLLLIVPYICPSTLVSYAAVHVLCSKEGRIIVRPPFHVEDVTILLGKGAQKQNQN